MKNKAMEGAARSSEKQGASIFRIPLMLAATTVVGLVAGLLGDGLLDVLAWSGLGLPVLACLYKST